MSHLEDLGDRIRPRAASNLLLWLVVGFVVVFVIWASLAKLDRAVHAPGRIAASGRLQVVSNLEGGIVSEILVRPGDRVRRGQPLVRLDRTQGAAELGSNEATVGALGAKVARLQAEIAGREPVYPATSTPEEAAQVAVERSLHLARLAELSSATAAGQARLAQATRAVIEARASRESRIAARDAAQQQLGLIRPLVDRGIEPRVTLIQLQREASVAASDAAQATAAIARAEAGVAEARAAITQVRETWRAQAGAELATAAAEGAARGSQVRALADRVRRTDVVSPVDGRVNRVLVATVGGSIGAGQPIAEVVPGADTLTVEARVDPKDIASVRIGQPARINVSAYDSAVYGSMQGKVAVISPDATVDERTGESFYTVRVEGDRANFRDPDGRRLVVGPGMTADVNLIGDRRSVMAYILTPFTRLGERALRE
jgi:adhesin transport system membrane fusion protein